MKSTDFLPGGASLEAISNAVIDPIVLIICVEAG
jgi:hypothetical protein